MSYFALCNVVVYLDNRFIISKLDCVAFYGETYRNQTFNDCLLHISDKHFYNPYFLSEQRDHISDHIDIIFAWLEIHLAKSKCFVLQFLHHDAILSDVISGHLLC